MINNGQLKTNQNGRIVKNGTFGIVAGASRSGAATADLSRRNPVKADLSRRNLVKAECPVTVVKKSEKSVKSVKSLYAHFSIGNCCRPINSNQNRSRAFYGFYVNFTGVYGGEGGGKC